MEEDEDNILSSRRYKISPNMDYVDQSQNESQNFGEVADYISSQSSPQKDLNLIHE